MSDLRQLLKRTYREIVMGRTTVRIINSSSPTHSISPIFLVGVFRSGTTLLRYMLDSHPRICCGPESNFILTLGNIISEEVQLQGLKSLGFNEDHVIERLAEFSSYFFENYMLSRGKQRWADKSPRYVDYLEFIRRLYPNARFVAIHRHGLDVANSYHESGWTLEKLLGDKTGEYSKDLRIRGVQYWLEQTRKIQSFCQAHSEDCITIKYEVLCTRPKKTMKKVLSFLDEKWSDDVLDFAAVAHDIGQEDGKIISSKNISPSIGNYLKWPKSVRRKAFDIAGKTLAELGYSAVEV